MSGTLLQIEDLTAGVDDASVPAVLDRVSLSVGAGERVALVGPSGAGKTSLVRLAMGLDRPIRRRSGSVTLSGQDVFAVQPSELRSLRRRTVAFVPQNPASALDPLMPLAHQWRQNLTTICGTPDEAGAKAHLDRLGLTQTLDAHPNAWSRGMQQRLLIAMALVRQPRLLVLDEPTSALDPIHSADVMQRIVAHARETGMAVLMVTHHSGLAASTCERIVRMERGRVVACDGDRAAQLHWSEVPVERRAGAGTPALGEPVMRFDRVDVERGGRTILKDVSFALRKGEALAVIGESGAGKSTLVQTVLGLLAPTAGRCTKMNDLPGLVFQDPLSALNPALRGDFAIAEPLVAGGQPVASSLREARVLAPRLGLDPSLLDRHAHDLSVGQAQRVCIARAVITNPRLIVLDEPLSALDHDRADEVIDLLLRLKSEFKPSLLVVTHDLGFARRIADRILVLRNGSVVECQDVEAFFAHPETEYSRALVSAARAIGDLGDMA